METPMQIRNRLLAEKLIKNFERRHMEAYYCPTAEEGVKKALELIPEGSSMTWGGSMTIRDMGLVKALHEKNYDIFDRDLNTDPAEYDKAMRRAFSMDWFLTSANAVSEDGQMVNIDGLGNRVAAITFGPKNVLIVVSLHKVCKDIESAVKRARSTAAPINSARFDYNLPCKVDGVCHDCTSEQCICSCIHILRNSKIPNRIKVIILGEEYGY